MQRQDEGIQAPPDIQPSKRSTTYRCQFSTLVAQQCCELLQKRLQPIKWLQFSSWFLGILPVTSMVDYKLMPNNFCGWHFILNQHFHYHHEPWNCRKIRNIMEALFMISDDDQVKIVILFWDNNVQSRLNQDLTQKHSLKLKTTHHNEFIFAYENKTFGRNNNK